MYNTLNNKLLEYAEESIRDVQTIMENTLSEPKVILGFIADDIQSIIYRDEGFEAIQAQMRYFSSDEFKQRITNFTYYSIYGFIDISDSISAGGFYEGGGWIPTHDFVPQERLWYIEAVRSPGEVIVTPVYVDVVTNTPVISYSRSLTDNEGNMTGVVSMDVPVNFINQFLYSTITDNSYGFIVDERAIVVVHPSDEYVGKYLVEVSSDISDLVYSIRDHDGISKMEYTSYTGARSIIFSSETFNGWYINFVVPENEYYRDLYNMMLIISILGIIMASLLSFLLIRIDAARKNSELLNLQKSSFLATMSHEIRTPMNSIIGFSELALDGDISQKTKQYLINITDNAKWLLNIINDILDSSKIESGKIALEHIPYDMQDVISQCQSAILPKATEKGLELYCYAEPLMNKSLVGDPVRLRQVFMNLLSNAIKFTDKGSVKLMASVKEIAENTATVSIEVKDTGIGMTPEQIANIFEPFVQADDSVTRKFGGTGLGLTITKNIIELLGGTMKVESKPGFGSRFSFDLTFDIIDANTSDIQNRIVLMSDIKKPGFNGEVLVCEDNTLNQQVICEHLARVGLKSTIAGNGKDAVEAVRKRSSGEDPAGPFDLIFMDIHMPVMDGLEASAAISKMGIDAPVIALTANIMSNDIELYKSSGMVDYLGKPFTTQDLWRCLIKYLPVVNYSEFDEKKQAAEEDKSLRQLRIYFARNNHDTTLKIIEAMDNGDLKLAHRITHTLKGNSGQIGEKQLQAIAASVEDMLRTGSTSAITIKTQIGYLEKELLSVLSNLAPLLSEEDKKPVIEITDTDKIMDILNKLEPMLKKSNPECMNMTEAIRTISGGEKLSGLVEDFEFKKALLELESLKSKIS